MVKKFDTNAEYHTSKAISASGLKTIAAGSVIDFLNKQNTETAAMRRGTAIHEAILEPDLFKKNYYGLPKIDKRTKAGKEELAKHLSQAGSKIMLDKEEYDMILNVAHNVSEDDLAKQYTVGIVEQSHYFTYNDIKCRCRPDCFDPVEGWISDVKSIRELTAQTIRGDIKNRFYDLQAVAYSRWLRLPPKNFRFIFVETKRPYKVEVVALSDKQIERGEYYFHKALNDWEFYLETGIAKGVEPVEYKEDGAKVF